MLSKLDFLWSSIRKHSKFIRYKWDDPSVNFESMPIENIIEFFVVSSMNKDGISDRENRLFYIFFIEECRLMYLMNLGM